MVETYYRDAWQIRRLAGGYHVRHYAKRLTHSETERVFQTLDEVTDFIKESEAAGYMAVAE